MLSVPQPPTRRWTARFARTCALLAILSIAAAERIAAQSPPPGWTTSRPATGIVTYTPPDLGPGETLAITVYPAAAIGESKLGAWLLKAMENDPFKPGRSASPPKLTREDEGKVAGGTHIYTLADGSQLGGIYSAVTVDGKKAYLMRVLFSPKGDVLNRYKNPMARMISDLVDRAKRERTGGAAPSTAPAGRGGIRPGGEVVEGIYEGNQVYHGTWGDRGREIRNRFRLHLYKNGEYRLCDEKDKTLRHGEGEYQYDAATGKIDIGRTFELTNSSYEPEKDFCLLGRDAQGKPYLYGENDRGLGILVTSLRYLGPISRPTPATEKQAQARAEAEARRYKWVTTPGKGVKNSQIEAIVYEYDVDVYYGGSGIGTNVKDQAFLLLKDGTLRKGLPVAPDQLDVARSRKMEPAVWGRWQAKGGKYVAMWPGNGSYDPLPGDKVRPGSPGMRLQGRWGTGSSSSSLMGGSYRLWGVTFSKDGRFIKDERGGSGNSQFMQNGGQPAINTTYDDNGSVTSATTPNSVVMAKRRKNPNGHRAGTYEINGYTLTLRYDNGQVARMPFFFSSADQSTLWFEGAQLAKDDKKK